MLAVPDLTPDARAAALAASAGLFALARGERQKRRPQRLLEPGHATWDRFRGQLGVRDLVALVFEDAAVVHPDPFDLGALLDREGDPLDLLPDDLFARWLADLPGQPLDTSTRDYLDDLARHLGLAARPAYSDLRKHQPSHHILELPGTGGRLAAHLVQTNPELSLRDAFTIACASWQEHLLAGLVAVELDVVGRARIVRATELKAMQQADDAPFTHVIGLRPDKGGRFSEFEIKGVYAGAEIVLV